jgi:hypothetical protein
MFVFHEELSAVSYQQSAMVRRFVNFEFIGCEFISSDCQVDLVSFQFQVLGSQRGLLTADG